MLKLAGYQWGMVIVLTSCIALAATLSSPHITLSQQNGATVITGYAWSDTIGWIDLNCANTNSCGAHNFGFSIAQNGDVSGYAWSETIGWVSANSSDLTGCPSGACRAKIAGNNLQGWLKVLAGGGSQSGGWDGWISLKGSGYGPTVTGGNFSGYAWGSDVVGWVDWAQAHSTFGQCAVSYSCSGQTIRETDTSCNVTSITTCIAPAFCSAGSSVCLYPPPSFIPSDDDFTGHLQVVPSMVREGDTATVYWNVADVQSCTVKGDVIDTTGWSATSGSEETSEILSRTTYTLDCIALDGTHLIETADVKIVPRFEEQ